MDVVTAVIIAQGETIMTSITEQSETGAANATAEPKGTKKATGGKRTHVVSKKATSGKKANPTKKAPKSAKNPDGARDGSKTAQVLELLKRRGGVTSKELMNVTGWQPHSVRGFLSGTIRKKLGRGVVSTKGEDGERGYAVKAGSTSQPFASRRWIHLRRRFSSSRILNSAHQSDSARHNPATQFGFDGRYLPAAARDSFRLLPALRRNFLERSPVTFGLRGMPDVCNLEARDQRERLAPVGARITGG
jgi:hypothetical protein